MPKFKYYLSLLIYLFLKFSLHAQSEVEKIYFDKVLAEIEATHSIVFNHDSNIVKEIKVFPLPNNLDLSDKIKNLENQTNLVFSRVSNAVYTISKAIKVCGYLKDDYLKSPLEGATINTSYQYAISDENGYFELELKSLEDTITIRYIGYKTIEQQVKLFNLVECKSITMFEEQEMINTVLLHTYLVRGIDKKDDWSTSIDYNKFSLLPGLIESDVLQTVQALPSIMSVDETVSNINIRGGSNDQNLILWDDIKMYQTSHFFGLISSFNPHMTQTATIINNGTDVSYTDGVSGTIHMMSEKKIDSEFGGVFGLNFLNTNLFSNIPTGKKSSLQIASRKSLDDLVRTPTYDAYFNRVTQETEAQYNELEVKNTNQEFDFYDTSLRWLYNPTDKDFIRFNFISIGNSLSFNETANVDGSLQTRRSEVSQNSIAIGVNYRKEWNENIFTTFNLYNSDYKLQSENANVLTNQLFLQKNTVSETGIKVENVYNKHFWKLKFGYNFTETEVINLNDIDLPRFVRRDEEILREHGVFAQAWYTNKNNDFSIRGGIRTNYLSKFNKVIFEPRLSIRKTLSNNIELEALGEFKHQSMSQIINFQNDFLGIEKRRWQLADNNIIPIIRSKQTSIGIMYKNEGWLLDAKAYYKTVDGITTQSQSFTTKYEFEKEKGSYNVYGLEFLFRKKIRRFNNWLSYSHINNTYTFENLKEIEFASNFNISNSFTLGSTYSNESWDISAGINYRLGKPTSIPISGNDIIDDNVNFDRANNENLKDYLRLDASAIYKFKLNNTLRSEIGASIWNISNRENTINNYYRINDTDTVNKFSRFSLGLTTNGVIRLYF